MKLDANILKTLIATIGFLPQNGKTGIYHKVYPSHDGYTIFVDFNQKKFVYDADTNPQNSNITVCGKTTSNFSQAENLVVLECVDRLLKKGYSPSSIELEKVYPSGRGHSGRLDILVKATDSTPFLMIECKTWGAEYKKEKLKMSKNGGQLFTYYCSARATRYLCLYSSRIETAIEYHNSIIDVEDTWAGLSEVKDIYSHWNKNFKDNGIFDSYAAPYDIRHRSLTYGELKTLKEEDSGRIYNQIMEILRHNAISDKSNAFNKLLNLFVCKIIDEDKNPEDELDFQWRESDTNESLQLRLNDLYKEGMWRFLEIRVIDYSQDDVAQKLTSLDPATKQWIMEMYTNTRLKKSPNFAFVEVQDERTFTLNAKVVREIVELLQIFKFRYAQRHEFLGNFFELLLNTSMKQEAGQYFTPVPITRFILSALPLQKLVQDRVNVRNSEPLPTVIDYACGSGHFLTEYMSQMQNIIDSGAIDLYHASPAVRSQFQVWQGIIKFQWARNTVYGIDLDNRLVKTTKVSAFFNGDGEANIVWANGLDHFTKSETYRDKLKFASGQDNGQFDILISNPPYSVDSFKGTIKFGGESFALYSYLTDNSSEIECLFVERTKQLLKVGGWAAVILPSSILSNSGIHARAREILLKYFNFKAIVELGSGTFMKTGTNTVVLFLERRKDTDYENIIREVDQFFATKNDVSAASLEYAFSTFVTTVYDGLSLSDYLSIFSDEPTETAKAHDLYLDYEKAFGEPFADKAIATEKDKLLYFLLTYQQEIVLVKAGSGKDEKKFLGYEFSERRGHEGLRWLPGGTMLYDETNLLNPNKASGYIYRAFLGEKTEIAPSLTKHIFYGRLYQFIEYGTTGFNKKINLGKIVGMKSQYPLRPMTELVDIIGGVTYDKSDQVYEETNQVVLTADNISHDGTFKISKKIYLREDFTPDRTKRLCKDDIFICMSSGSKIHVGKCAIISENLPYFAGGFMGILRKKANEILPKYLWAVLSSKSYRLFLGQSSTGSNINNIGSKLGAIKIPFPPSDIQRKIVDEIEAVENREKVLKEKLSLIQNEVSAVTESLYQSDADFVKLRTVASYSKEKINAERLDEHTYVGVDNLLTNVAGKRASEFVPVAGTVTAYHPGNILLSNIRPYLKKAWLADNHGGASGDVLVLTVDEKKALPRYVFALVSTDRFFAYEMQNISSNVKMPRADKRKVLDFSIPLFPLDEQEKIMVAIQQSEEQITRLRTQLSALKAEKESVLKKYL